MPHTFGVTYADFQGANLKWWDIPYLMSIMVLPSIVASVGLGLLVCYLIAFFFRSISGEWFKWCYKVDTTIDFEGLQVLRPFPKNTFYFWLVAFALLLIGIKYVRTRSLILSYLIHN
jgi:hypothetical protein